MRSIGLVILGASIYEHHGYMGNYRFANSAREFKKVCGDTKFVSEAVPKVLNLFDRPLSPGDTTKKIADFLKTGYDYIVIYYCGHGDVPRRKGGGYRVFLRGSNKDLRSTLLNISDLIGDLSKLFIRKKVFIILDACFSGEAIEESSEFMDGGAIASMSEARLFEALPQTGVAIVAATCGTDVALAKSEDKLTLFTGALVDCVRNGIATLCDKNTLSWLDVKDQIAKATQDRLGAEAPIPHISTRDERHGDVTRMPFFINRAYVPVKNIVGVPPIVPFVDERTSEHLYWSRVPTAADVEVYDDFLRKFPAGTFAPVAQAQIRNLVQVMGRIELERFLQDFPLSYGAPLAEACLVKLRRTDKEQLPPLDLDPVATVAPQPPPIEPNGQDGEDKSEQPLTSQVEPEKLQTPQDAIELPQRESRRTLGANVRALIGPLPRVLVIFAVVVALMGITYLLSQFGYGEQFRTELQSTGNDTAKLTAFIERCQLSPNCLVLSEARDKLKSAQTERERQIQAERDRQAQAERDRQAQQFRNEFQSAGNDIAKLTAFIERCQLSPNCLVLSEARDKLKSAQTERERQLQAERDRQAQAERDRQAQQFRNEFQSAGIDIAKLTAFIERCQLSANCPVLSEAREKVKSAQSERERQLQAERDRQAQAERDRQAQQFRNDLQTAGNDMEKLRVFVARCRSSPNCPVLAEAETQLKRAEAEHNRLENTFGWYFNWDLDLGSNELLQTIQPSENIDACKSACQAAKACRGFTFNRWNNVCYLKSDFVVFSFDPRAVSGLRKSVQAPYASNAAKKFCVYKNSVVEGDVIRTIANSADSEACKNNCANESKCAAYNFLPTSNECRLLSDSTGRSSGRVGEGGIKSQNPICQK